MICFGLATFADALRRFSKGDEKFVAWPTVRARVIDCWSDPPVTVTLGFFTIAQRTFAHVAYQVDGAWYESKCEIETGKRHKKGDLIDIQYDPTRPAKTLLVNHHRRNAKLELAVSAIVLLVGVYRVSYLIGQANAVTP